MGNNYYCLRCLKVVLTQKIVFSKTALSQQIISIVSQGNVGKVQHIHRIYLDSQKAFARVLHKGLFRKLNSPEVKGKVVFWGRTWLETDKKRRNEVSAFHAAKG